MGGRRLPRKYDDASWHFEGDFPDDLPVEAAATHIGMFLAWAVSEGLASKEFLDDNAEGVDALRRRKTTPGAFLLAATDGKLGEDDLSPEGRAFARAHYLADEAPYLEDYERLLCKGLPSLYHAADSWENYDRLARAASERLAAWRKARGRERRSRNR